MTKYVISNSKDTEQHTQYCKNIIDAKEWVVSHLDISKNWNIKEIEFFECISCGHEKNTIQNIDCDSCALSEKKFRVYSKLGLEDRLY
jgi:Zn ribbon nucleic-acid-binding protein